VDRAGKEQELLGEGGFSRVRMRNDRKRAAAGDFVGDGHNGFQRLPLDRPSDKGADFTGKNENHGPFLQPQVPRLRRARGMFLAAIVPE
jgi:hypothetical protein